MAVTVDWVILPHQKKDDGTNFIRLRVTNKRKSKYIKTSISVGPDDLTRSGNLKDQGKKDRADDEVRKWRRIVDSMPTISQDEMDVAEIVGYIKAKIIEQEVFHLNFASYGMKLAEAKKECTAYNYKAAIKCLCRFFGHEPDIREITVKSMREFESFIRDEKKIVYNAKKGTFIDTEDKKSERSVTKYLGIVRAIYKRARLEYNEPDRGIMRIPVDIFEYYKVPEVQQAPEPRDIPAEWIQMMIDQRKNLKGRQRFGVDAFLLCFGLMGMNPIDMMKCGKAKDGIIHYYRTKTTDKKADKAEMYVRIEPCIMNVLREYQGTERLLDYHLRYKRRTGLITAINDGLKQWIDSNKLEDFTSYSARHTWATLGASKEVGVEFGLVTEGLSHSDPSRKMDMVYIRKDWERVWDANAKVLALFKW